MNFQHLRTFATIARTGSFTKAAHTLCLTQPAVTAQIKLLESELQVRLFERDRVSKKTSLTYEGETLLTYTDRVFAVLHELEATFEDVRKLHKGGKVSIGATAVIGIYFLPSRFRQFRTQYPGVIIDNRIGNSREIMEKVLASEVEIGIVRKIRQFPSHITATFLHSERLVWIAAPNHPLPANTTLSLDNIRDIPFINRENGTRTRVQIEQWMHDHAMQRLSTIDVGHIEAVKKAVEQEVGLSIVPEIAVKRELEAGQLKTLTIDGFNLLADYYLIALHERTLSNTVQAFIHVLRKPGTFAAHTVKDDDTLQDSPKRKS
jgi:DNA-binding transcriptional LysR family regulator